VSISRQGRYVYMTHHDQTSAGDSIDAAVLDLRNDLMCEEPAGE
jgi:hypothetical protein